MTNSYTLQQPVRKSYGWLYIVLIFISFIWISAYPAACIATDNFYLGYGNLFDMESGNFSSFVMLVLSQAVIYWLAFELIFYLYRWFLGFKIYSFIVPADRLKQESRIFFIYRNCFYGIFVNLCFLYPYLYSFTLFFDLVITLIAVIAFASHLNKTYAEPVVGHFVFKSFIYPIFIYEALMLISEIVGVLAWKR